MHRFVCLAFAFALAIKCFAKFNLLTTIAMLLIVYRFIFVYSASSHRFFLFNISDDFLPNLTVTKLSIATAKANAENTNNQVKRKLENPRNSVKYM